MIKFIRNQSELLTLVLAVLLFIFQPPLIRLIDPTAAPIDAGVISLVITAIVAVLTFQALTWICIKMVWPVIQGFFENDFTHNFNKLQSWQKILVGLGIYFFIFYLFVATLQALK